MHTSAQRAKARARHRTGATRDNVIQLPLELNAGDVVPSESEDVPFDPPPADDILGLGECEEEETVFLTADDEAPFDPPEFEDEPVFSAPASVRPAETTTSKPAPLEAKPTPTRNRPLPAISVFMSWDRPQAELLMRELAADPRFARAEIQISSGGLDAAVAHGGADLFLLDTTLDGAPMLAALDRLRAGAPRACVVILGSVNDITLLRELAARGVRDYFVPPANANDVARSLCALFADVEPARSIAVIGARGGIGASTIARNVAWSIAERQQLKTTLVDLDLCFGAAASSFRCEPELSVLDVIGAGENADEVLERTLSKPTPRLQVLPAPAKTAPLEVEPGAFGELMANVRRTAPFVVLDLPHAWEPWVRSALREADEVVVVAGADLASLRNTDNLLKLMRSERDKPSAPVVVITMTGMAKRPEIPTKDFGDALRAKPEFAFAFEPELFAAAEANGQMIYEAMPDSRAALQLDRLASLLTGQEAVARPSPRIASSAPVPAAEKSTARLPALELVTPAPTAPLRRRRRPARTGFVALQQPPRENRPVRGLLRTLAAVAALAAVGVWWAGQHGSSVATTAQQEEASAFRA